MQIAVRLVEDSEEGVRRKFIEEIDCKVGQPFQNGGQMRLSRAARGPELQTKTQNEDCILLQYLYCKSGNSVRWLVLLAMEKDINVRLDG